MLVDFALRPSCRSRTAPLCAGLLLLAATLAGCAPTISPYSPWAYEQATALKVEALALMEAADEPFSQHKGPVRRLRTDLKKAHEFARGRPQNEISTRQWAILIDPERNLLGGFLKRWEDEGILSPVFIQEAKRIVADAFDTIIGLESGKIKPEDVAQDRP